MLKSTSNAARRPSTTVRPKPHRASPQSAMKEYRQAARVVSVSHAATPPHATLSRPTPISIAPNTPPASGGMTPRVPATTTTARAGPMNAIHAMGDAVTASSGSNGWRYGSRPTPAAIPAMSPTAAKRPSTSGPVARARTSAKAITATASTGARRRIAKDRLPAAAAFSTPSPSSTSRASSKVGPAAIASGPASPAPPRSTSERRGAGAGAKRIAKARTSAANKTTSADSGSIGGLHGKPSGARGEQRGGEVRPWALPGLGRACGRGDRQCNQSQRGQQDGGLLAPEHPGSRKTHDRHHGKPQRRTRARRHRKRDPEHQQAGRDAEHEPRRRTRRHELPAVRTVRESTRRHDRSAQRQYAGVDRGGALKNDERDARRGKRGAEGEAAASVGENDQRHAQPGDQSRARIDHLSGHGEAEGDKRRQPQDWVAACGGELPLLEVEDRAVLLGHRCRANARTNALQRRGGGNPEKGGPCLGPDRRGVGQQVDGDAGQQQRHKERDHRQDAGNSDHGRE